MTGNNQQTISNLTESQLTEEDTENKICTLLNKIVGGECRGAFLDKTFPNNTQFKIGTLNTHSSVVDYALGKSGFRYNEDYYTEDGYPLSTGGCVFVFKNLPNSPETIATLQEKLQKVIVERFNDELTSATEGMNPITAKNFKTKSIQSAAIKAGINLNRKPEIV